MEDFLSVRIESTVLITIVHLAKNADLTKVAAAASKLGEIAKEVAEGDPLYAGVAFGTQTWEQIAKSKKLPPPEGNHTIRIEYYIIV